MPETASERHAPEIAALLAVIGAGTHSKPLAARLGDTVQLDAGFDPGVPSVAE